MDNSFANIILPPPIHAWNTTLGIGFSAAPAVQLGCESTLGGGAVVTAFGARLENSRGFDHDERSPRRRLFARRARGMASTATDCEVDDCGGADGECDAGDPVRNAV